MTAARSHAYGRVMRTLSSAVPNRLTGPQEQQLRELADTLLFAPEFDAEVRDALATARAILLTLPGDRLDPWVDRLAEELEACGPGRPSVRS